jgi:Peptidase_C39 like family
MVILKVVFWGVLLLFISLLGAVIYQFIPRPLAPQGGFYFWVRQEIPVPAYFQNDPRWATDKLAQTPQTLAAEGCAVTAAAMVLASYGLATDPGELNVFLRANDGFTERGWLKWEKAVPAAHPSIRFVYEGLPSYGLMDTQLLLGNPVIVRVRYPSNITHFLVVVGKEGWDYLVLDPQTYLRPGISTLSEFGSPVEALRYYKRR